MTAPARPGAAGYAHPGYALSLAEFGTPRLLPRSGGWVLERPIAGSPHCDATGCYPLFDCADWSSLHLDLAQIGEELVSLALVTTPFGDYDRAHLERAFPDVAIPFKEHFVVDLTLPPAQFVSEHHLRNARKAAQRVSVERCDRPEAFLDDWCSLYATLIDRHEIHGISAFSPASFARQLAVPGTVVFRAIHAGTTVGMLLWYVQGDVGYYHLGAYSPIGYELRASFALFPACLEHFAQTGLRWLCLGAGAGVQCDGQDGLTRFKRGWSTGTRTAYFCGRIFNEARYAELVRAAGAPVTRYFPAYRCGGNR